MTWQSIGKRTGLAVFLLVIAGGSTHSGSPVSTAPSNAVASSNAIAPFNAAARSNAAAPDKKFIVFFGNSLTAGYGVSPGQAFPALIGRRIDSLHLPYKVVNAGLSGETSAGGKTRIGWILRQPVNIFVLELGANDGLRGIPVGGTAANLQAIIDSVKARYPGAKIILAGMQVPPSMGSDYAMTFQNNFRQLAAKNKAALIPFLLQGVGGIPQLNQRDLVSILPRKEHKIVAENVWRVLKKLI